MILKLKILYINLLFLGTLFFYQNNHAQNFPIKIEGFAQGTTYHITYYDKKNRNFQKKIEKILINFDNSVSIYQPESIISKINKNNINVKLDNYFTYCFFKAKEYYKITDSLFDPTVYPLTNAWGFGPEKKQNLTKYQTDSVLHFVGFDKIDLIKNKIIKKDSRIKLDFNGFAQGYSVDIISEFLEKKGIESYIVEIGGEIYANGLKPDNSNWSIGVEKPIDNKNDNNESQLILHLNGKAIATSGDYHKFYMEGDQKYGHHFNPKTGYPIKNEILSCTIIADTCIDADAISTGILVMGLKNAINFLNKHKEYGAILMYENDGILKVYETENLKNLSN